MAIFTVSTKTKAWLQGLFAVIISAFATAVSGIITLPTVFNFTHNGIINTLKVGAIPALYAGFNYLKKSPLPGSVLEPGDIATLKDPVISADGSMSGSSATLVKGPADGTLPPKP